MGTRLIVNPTAGSGRAWARLSTARARLEAGFPDLEWVESRSHEHVSELAADAARLGFERVIVAGGDGTIHFAANGLAGTETALGLLPVGSGNDVADSIGVPRDLDAAVSCLLDGHVRAIDVGRVADRVYVCVLGVGMDTDALHRIHGARFLRRGKLLYSLAALQTLFTYRPRRMTIQCEGGPRFQDHVVFAAVTNTRTYAGGMRVSPRADVADGRLDLCAIRRTNIFGLLARFGRILPGRHAGMDGVVIAQSARVRIDAEEPLPVTLDGELTDLRTPIDVRVWPGALRVIAAPVMRRIVPSLQHAEVAHAG